MHDENQHDDAAVERHLNAQRAELAPVELDRVKRGVLAKAARQGGRGMLRSRLAVMLIAIGLVGTGGGAVLAASGGSSSNGSSSHNQYCPPSSPGHGKPKHHGGGNKCGHPKDCDKKNNGKKHKDKCKCDKKNHKKCPH
jgi:hypothetical protein